MRPIPAVVAAAVLAVLPACASVRANHERPVISDAELLAGGSLRLTGGAVPAGDEEVLAVTPEMRAFLGRHVARGADPEGKLRQLSRAIRDGDRFGLVYDESTRTAGETFVARRGNCLSFSNMFVAMARAVGLEASFQEVDIPPDWSLRDDTFILNRHVNVLVDVGRRGPPRTRLGSLTGKPVDDTGRIVDFNIEEFRTTYDRRRISDERGLAHYHNNVGVERMQAGDAASALASFRRALEKDPSFAPAWTNLGILYVRQGARDHAEAAYLRALAAQEDDLVAMSNLASLYERRGDRERATAYRRRVESHRQRNPYYRLHLARLAYRTEDYDAAIRHLNDAVRRKKNDDQIYFLLGMSHLRKGHVREARTWLSRAERAAATEAQRRRYESKREALLPQARDERERP